LRSQNNKCARVDWIKRHFCCPGYLRYCRHGHNPCANKVVYTLYGPMTPSTLEHCFVAASQCEWEPLGSVYADRTPQLALQHEMPAQSGSFISEMPHWDWRFLEKRSVKVETTVASHVLVPRGCWRGVLFTTLPNELVGIRCKNPHSAIRADSAFLARVSDQDQILWTDRLPYLCRQ
jgi:hypothetical protein